MCLTSRPRRTILLSLAAGLLLALPVAADETPRIENFLGVTELHYLLDTAPADPFSKVAEIGTRMIVHRDAKGHAMTIGLRRDGDSTHVEIHLPDGFLAYTQRNGQKLGLRSSLPIVDAGDHGKRVQLDALSETTRDLLHNMTLHLTLAFEERAAADKINNNYQFSSSCREASIEFAEFLVQNAAELALRSACTLCRGYALNVPNPVFTATRVLTCLACAYDETDTIFDIITAPGLVLDVFQTCGPEYIEATEDVAANVQQIIASMAISELFYCAITQLVGAPDVVNCGGFVP